MSFMEYSFFEKSCWHSAFIISFQKNKEVMYRTLDNFILNAIDFVGGMFSQGCFQMLNVNKRTGK